jgi:hypothetical protein
MITTATTNFPKRRNVYIFLITFDTWPEFTSIFLSASKNARIATFISVLLSKVTGKK